MFKAEISHALKRTSKQYTFAAPGYVVEPDIVPRSHAAANAGYNRKAFPWSVARKVRPLATRSSLWVSCLWAVKEFKLNYHISDTILYYNYLLFTTIYIELYIYTRIVGI